MHVAREFKHKVDTSLVDLTLRSNSISFNVVIQVLEAIMEQSVALGDAKWPMFSPDSNVGAQAIPVISDCIHHVLESRGYEVKI